MKRRTFIQSAALAATPLLAPRVHGGTAAPTEELQVGLIGVGRQGRVLMNAAMPIPGLRVRAVADIWAYARNYGQKYLGRHGHKVNTYVDYREMLDKEKGLDAVLVATPDFVHAAQTNDCLAAGIHVYCEPMLAHSVAAARSIVQAMRDSGKLVQVGYQRRSNPRYRHVREKLLQEARLPGRLTAVQTQWARQAAPPRGWPRRFTIPDKELRSFGYQDMQQFRNWIWYPKYCSGPFGAYASHQLDVCDWFLGAPPRSVMASGGADYYDDRPNLDTVMSIFEFPGTPAPLRASCALFTATSAGGMRQYERFSGDEGSLQISENPHWTRIGREPNAGEWDKWVRNQYLVKPKVAAAHASDDDEVDVHVSGEIELFQLPKLTTASNCQPHLENFFAAVRGDAALRCPADVAFRSQVAACKAIEAARARQTRLINAAD